VLSCEPVQQRAESALNYAVEHFGADHVIEQSITGAPDLVQLRQEVLTFLAGVQEHIVTDAVLVTIMLAGDAFRYGKPPVTLRLRHLTDRRCLRVEVEDHRRLPSARVADGYRASILDRIASARGMEQYDGITMSWAEISLRDPRRVMTGA
jgi:hypothetical protein